MSIITHILAAMGGGFVGIAVMALCFASSKADEAEERMEKHIKESDHDRT